MANPNDTTTELNPGSGGDTMDETSVVQSDGETSAKRPRVDVGFAGDDEQGRLVAKGNPLPVSNEEVREVLQGIAKDLSELKSIVFHFLNR